tara:strand:+ start:5285 stop:6487 length:1203 start_codon:yes stop_codon:yes gene_type:complete
MFADQNLMGPNMTLIGEEFGFTSEVDRYHYLGSLINLAFWILGGTVSLFIGYFTDIISRKKLFLLVIVIGEIPCLLSGFADTYPQFFIMRALTGIGIGGIIPLTYSLLGDYYSSKERIKIVTLIGFASGLGVAIGQLASGMLGDIYNDWRLPFIIFAIPNFFLAILFFLTVNIPKRGNMDNYSEKLKISDFKNFRYLFKTKTNSLVFLQGLFGTVPWAVFGTYMIDYLSSSELLQYDKGTATLAITLVGGMALLSSLLGGFIGDKLYKKNPKFLPFFCGVSTILGVIPTVLLINVPPNNESLLFTYAAFTGLFIALTPPNMKVILMNVNNPLNRGKVFSLYNFSDDLGRGFGPFIIGSLLVFLFDSKVAFNIASIFWIICGLLILMMIRTFPNEHSGGLK